MTEKIIKLLIDTKVRKSAFNMIHYIRENSDSYGFIVVGDLIIDKYNLCNVNRKNLEHDSMIYDLFDSSLAFGGASNVANIIGTFVSDSSNKTVSFLSGCGTNDRLFLKSNMLIDPNNFKLNLFVDKHNDNVIPIKTRFISLSRNEYLCRFDKEPNKDEFSSFSPSIYYNMLSNINDNLYDSIVISDYNKGFLSDSFINSIFNISKHKFLYCNVRPKKINQYFNIMHLMSFNKTEFIQVYDKLFNEVIDIISVDKINNVKEMINVTNMIITFGMNGFLFCGDGLFMKVDTFKSLNVGSKNVIGAGDMITAAFSFFDTLNRVLFNSSYSIETILYLVNACAFLKVYTGSYTVDLSLLSDFISGNLCLF